MSDLTIKQAAETLGVHVNTIRAWIKAGTLYAYQLGGTRIIRIPAEAIDAIKLPAKP